MKNLFKIAIMAMATLAMMFALDSCKKEKIETMTIRENAFSSDTIGNYTRDWGNVIQNDTTAPMISSNLPIFPCEVLFVVNKEYEMVVEGRSEKTYYHGTPILSYQQPDYVELRLIELYPDIAYEGVMEDSRNFCDSVFAVYNTYLSNNQSIGNRGYKPELPYLSEENEMDILEMTELEKENYIQYIKLAGMEGFATLDDIFKTGGKNQSMKAVNFNWDVFATICAIIDEYYSYAYYRAMLCAQRASNKANEYYNGQTGPGQIGDAYRHVAMNFLLRYYLGEAMAFLIMDVYYEGYYNPDPYPCDTHMDLHNNAVGRHYKYNSFFVGDTWLNWLASIKDYINNSDNAAYKNWSNSTSWLVAYVGRLFTSGNKYIYYQS